MRLAVIRKLLLSVSAVALVTSACAENPEPTVDLGEGRRFVPEVVDFAGDIGRDPAITLNADGAPYVSYWGFPEVLEEGEIPPSRPIQAATPPGAFLASDKEGLFSRGAFAQGEPIAGGVKIPFGPVYDKALGSATPENSQGTAVAVGDDGTIHGTWVSDAGLWYGTTTDAGPAEVEQIVKLPGKLDRAGPLGWPAIALGPDGAPWIAWGDNTGAAQTVEVAHAEGERWVIETVAELDRCAGCPQPQRVAIASGRDGVTIAYADTAADAPVAAVQTVDGWEQQVIESGGGGFGISLAVDADGEPRATYYTADGAVHESRRSGRSWGSAEIAPAAEIDATLDESIVARLRTTGIAVDGEGTSWATWFDSSIPGIKLASSADSSSWEEIPTTDTAGGASPAIAVTDDAAAVYVAWYDTTNQNLVLGTYADAGELALANPSPTATGAPAAQEPTGEPTGPAETELTIVAPPGAAANGFDTTTLLAAANEELTVTFDNQEPGVPHNWKLHDGPDETAPEIAGSADLTGPASEDVTVEPLDPGEYFYLCTIHPTTMTGTLTAE